MPSETLVSEILRRGEEDSRKPAFIFLSHNQQRKVLTFGDVSELGRKYAAVLHSLGIQPGDVVCNTVGTSVERLITQVGTMLAGAVDMNGQVCLADGSDFIKALNDGQAKAVIYNPHEDKGAFTILKDKVVRRDNGASGAGNGRSDPAADNMVNFDAEEGKAAVGRKVFCAVAPSVEMVIPCILEISKGQDVPLLEALKAETKLACVDRGPDAVSTYFCTSGSTGYSKLVACTGRFVLIFGRNAANVYGCNYDSVFLNERNFGWMGGYFSVTFNAGCTRVVIDESIPRSEGYVSLLWDVIALERCTIAMGNPNVLWQLVKEAKNKSHKDNYKLKCFNVGGGPINRNVQDAIGVVSETVSTFYACSEANMVASRKVTSQDKDYTRFQCGWPIPGTEFKVVDRNDGMKELPIGVTGDILFKPSQRCIGYVNNEKANAETFLPGGWVNLGDRGFLDETGQITVLGRGQNAVNRGGLTLYTEEVESFIEQCPGLASVVVVGVPDSETNEEICALLIREREGEAGQGVRDDVVHEGSSNSGREVGAKSDQFVDVEQVRKFCKRFFINEKLVNLNPMPKYFFFVNTFPTLANGKLDRAGAKRLATELVDGRKQV